MTQSPYGSTGAPDPDPYTEGLPGSGSATGSGGVSSDPLAPDPVASDYTAAEDAGVGYSTSGYSTSTGSLDEPVTTGYEPSTTGALGGASAYGTRTTTDQPSSTGDVAKDQAGQVKDTAVERGQQVAGVAKEQAGQVKDTAVEQGQQVAGVAKEQASNVAGEAVSQAKDLFQQGRSELSSQLGNQQSRLASIVHDLSDELGTMASKSDRQGPFTDLAKRGSRAGGELAHWLQDNEPGDALDQLRSFARRRPGVFLAGSLIAGVVVGRLTRGLAADAKAEREASQGGRALTGGQTYGTSYAQTTYPDTPVYSDVAGQPASTGTGAYYGSTDLPATTVYSEGADYRSTADATQTGYASGTGYASEYGEEPARYGDTGQGIR